MARVTVEDCFKKTERFSLIILASRRVRDIENGAPIFVDRDGDKNPVIALREIAADLLDLKELEENIIRVFSKHQTDELFEEMILDEDPVISSTHLETDTPDVDGSIGIESEPDLEEEDLLED